MLKCPECKKESILPSWKRCDECTRIKLNKIGVKRRLKLKQQLKQK